MISVLITFMCAWMRKLVKSTVDMISIRPEDIFVCLDIAMNDEDKIRLSDRCNLKVI